MTTSPNQTVLAETKDGICTITLNRPEALNALEHDMVAALGAVTGAAREDETVRAVVITGAGDHFMAGGDIKTFKSWVDAEPDKAALGQKIEGFVHTVHPTVRNLREMEKPVIASVRGSVAGFGMSLMLACDLVVAADDAVFTLAYCHIGQSPDGGSTYALPRTVGLKHAFEIACLGDRFGPEEAKAFGLINRVVAEADLESETAKLAARLANGPTRAYASTKALLNASLHRGLEDQMAAEAAAFGDGATTADFEEGLTAFVEKHPPSFKGR